MARKPNGPVRRAQLISPFGTGAILTVPEGISMMTCGLDHWYTAKDPNKVIDTSEYKIREWRLERQLGVSHLRRPPDYRERQSYDSDTRNQEITIPFVRFPQWHMCHTCGALESRPLDDLGSSGHIRCPYCVDKKPRRYMTQVRFIAICEHGHIQDFPWREWVHRQIRPSCTGRLQLRTGGQASLKGIRVVCECGAVRSLTGIMGATETGTSLSRNLEPGSEELYLCQGRMPWNGPDAWEPCQQQVRGALINASNVYFPVVRSSIYLPRFTSTIEEQLIILFETDHGIKTTLDLLLNLRTDEVAIADHLHKNYSNQLRRISTSIGTGQLVQAVRKFRGQGDQEQRTQSDEPEYDEPREVSFRRAEYDLLRTEHDSENLRILPVQLAEYRNDIFDVSGIFSHVMLVEKLKETRAMTGFTRVMPDGDRSLLDLQNMLWRKPPRNYTERWLPAYEVYGEGIFLEVSPDRLGEWEQKPRVINRIKGHFGRLPDLQERDHNHEISPRFLLLHTLAHLLINRLIFESGYSSASLRERLYVSSLVEAPMSGVLLYTAAGDSDGTMGGLVRLGKPGNLEYILLRALEGAHWCSNDPVCMETGGCCKWK